MAADPTELAPYMHPFPEAEEVFSDNLEQHRRHFLPLISLDASTFDPSWGGRLHIVSVKECCDGAVGEHCREHHTELCKDNQIAFRVSADGRYTFLADFKFFVVEPGAKPETYDSTHFVDEFEDFYAEAQSSYDATKAHFLRSGVLNVRALPILSPIMETIVSRTEANTCRPSPPPHPGARFIARCTAWSYYENGPDSVSLYFDPAERVAIMVFDFS